MDILTNASKEGLKLTSLFLITIIIYFFIHKIVFDRLNRSLQERENQIYIFILNNINRPLKILVPLLLIDFETKFLNLQKNLLNVISHLEFIFIIIATSWLLIGTLNILTDILSIKYNTNVNNNLKARRINTHAQILKRIFVAFIIVVGFLSVLMTFPEFNSLATGIFASAGITGIIIGFSAKATISNLFSGLQIMLTEPIKIDDVVIVDGEWGKIEEIKLTYVVVRVWDMRRLIIPISYFTNSTFQNWTLKSSDLIGTVFIYTDYVIPVEKVRSELLKILENNSKWDRKFWGLQITDTNDKTMQLRALMSSTNSSELWDLRCEVRESLINFLQKNYPQSLPKSRIEILKNN